MGCLSWLWGRRKNNKNKKKRKRNRNKNTSSPESSTRWCNGSQIGLDSMSQLSYQSSQWSRTSLAFPVDSNTDLHFAEAVWCRAQSCPALWEPNVELGYSDQLGFQKYYPAEWRPVFSQSDTGIADEDGWCSAWLEVPVEDPSSSPQASAIKMEPDKIHLKGRELNETQMYRDDDFSIFEAFYY